VIPRDDRAGKTRDEQKERGRDAEPAMQANQNRSHAREYSERRSGATAIISYDAM
jgi:hypothetical protein